MNKIQTALATATAATAIALAIIPEFEGTRYIAYLDPVGIPTICEGYTKGVKLGDTADRAECDAKTLESIKEADGIFQKWIPLEVRAKLSPNTYASFLSFIYNVGPGGKGVKDGFVFLKNGRHSTMYRKLAAGDIRGACEQFKYWQRPRLRGIQLRREAEEKLCLSGLN